MRWASNLTRHKLMIDKPARAAQKNQKACVLWFTGIDSPYEPPESPDIVLKTGEQSVDELADQVIAYLRSRVDFQGP